MGKPTNFLELLKVQNIQDVDSTDRWKLPKKYVHSDIR